MGNRKFAVGKDLSFPTFQINMDYKVCIPKPQILVQRILSNTRICSKAIENG